LIWNTQSANRSGVGAFYKWLYDCCFCPTIGACLVLLG
jgi:hypothetical protein